MISRRGNSSTYNPENGNDLALPDRSDADTEAAWQRATNYKKNKMADPLITLDYEVKTFQFRRDADRRDAVRFEDFSRTLVLMALVTGDKRFQGTADAMKERGLVAGGIRETLIATADNAMFNGDVIAMPCVHGWLEWLKSNGRRASVKKAAMLAAIDLKIPGASFAAVVDKLRKNYPKWRMAGGGHVSW